MCGIVGLVALGKLGKNEEAKRQQFMRFASTELMLRTDERGKDATGAAILFTDGNYAGIKRGEEATKWFAKFGNTKDRYGSLLKIWEEYEHPVKIYMGHCRKGTIGDKEDNENNHPIKIGNIIGIHNGVIRNDKEIQEHLGCKRDGKVDSEMIFRLMHYLTNEGKEPFTMPMIEQLISRLTGAWAVMAFNADNMYQLPLFCDGRPIELLLIKELSLLVIISDIKFWNSFHFQYERTLFYAKLKRPSLLDMSIEKKTMSDDSAAIIDIDVKCSAETTIEDIWQWQKIRRDNKIWTSHVALNKSNVAGVSTYNGGQSMVKTETPTTTVPAKTDTPAAKTEPAKADGKKETETGGTQLRVLNNITRRYEIRHVENPVKLGKDESAIIPLNKEEVASPTSTADDNSDINKEAISKLTFGEDTAGQEDTADKLVINDYTDYEEEKKELTTSSSVSTKSEVRSGSEDVIDVEGEVIENNKDVSIVEVDMTVDNIELMALASKAYNNIPIEDRGYSNVDNLLTDIEIKDEATANLCGIKLLANRVANVQWVRGFIAGWIHRDKDLRDDEVKTKVREKHISNLKSMVVILASFFSRSKKSAPVSDQLLESIATDHLSKRPSFDINNVKGIFNAHEEGKIQEAEAIISSVAKEIEK